MALAQFVGAEFASAPVGGQVQAEVEKPCALAADGSSQVYGQGADDGVTALNVRCVQMGQMLVDAQALLYGPDLGTGVAADEKSRHCAK